jgi:organic radical activating enzyme
MDYYCSAKFTDLQVHVQSRLLYNCCNAWPERINLDWLEANPGKLFYTDTMLEDRKTMLEDKSCKSCHYGCYKYEEKNLSSKRLEIRNPEYINDPMAPLRNLSISLSTDCNLTCMYCGPEFSSSWQKDIEKNGDYQLSGSKLQNDNWAKLWSKMKQKSRSTETKFLRLLLKEISMANHITELSLLGGEPLLHNGIAKIIDSAEDKKITITSGLGISANRLSNFLEKFKERKIKFILSAEATGRYFELLRYGHTWSDFQHRVKMLEDSNNEIEFTSVISNISSLDFINFYEVFKRYPIRTNPLTERPHMMPHVLDDNSKKQVLEQMNRHRDDPQVNKFIKSIETDPTATERADISNYLKDFSKRRSIDLEFLPESFKNWCGIVS